MCVQTHGSQRHKSREKIYACHTNIVVTWLFLLSGKPSFSEFSAMKGGHMFLHLVRKREQERDETFEEKKV